MSVSDIARTLATQRKAKIVTCPICGTEVIGFGRRQYCSHRCANIASYRRKQLTKRPNQLDPSSDRSTPPPRFDGQDRDARTGDQALLLGRRSPLEDVLRRASHAGSIPGGTSPDIFRPTNFGEPLPDRPIAIRGIDRILSFAVQLLQTGRHSSVRPHTQQILLTSFAEHDVFDLLPNWRAAWLHSLGSALWNGWDVVHLIGLTGDLARIAGAVGDMLQLIAAGPGTYLPSYYSHEGVALPDLLVLPGHGALELFATGQERYIDTAFYYPPGAHTDTLADRFRLLQAQTRSAPLLRRHELWGPASEILKSTLSIDAVRVWEEAITRVDEQPGNADLVDGLNETTVQPFLYQALTQPILAQGGGAASLMRMHLGYRERRCAAFQKCVEKSRYRHLLPERSLEWYRRTGYYSEDSWLAYLGGARASVDQFVAHLEAIIDLIDSSRGGYQLRIFDDTQNGDARNVYWQVKQHYAVMMEAWRHDAANGEDVECDIEISAPPVVQGFADYFEELWNRAHYQGQNDVVQRLRFYIGKATEQGVGPAS